jgi:Uma2 family endonuclease
MSSIVDPPSETQWMPPPESIYRLSVEQYEAMVASGIFTKRDRFHLVNGILVAKMTEYPRHASTCDAAQARVSPLLPAGWYIRMGKPLRIPSRSSEPEPDAVVARGSYRDYALRHPGPADVTLVVEVADSSLREDREMTSIYGGSGVPIYWIINLVDRHVEVYSTPYAAGYESREVFRAGELVPLLIDGVEVGRIAVDDLIT